jgi:hypothetical protein
MQRHLAKNAVTEPLETLFAGLTQSITATNQGLALSTADELREPLPRVKIVGEMFGKSK